MNKYELYTALVTPTLENGNVDYQEFKRLIEYQILNGVDGIVIGGTTGLGCFHTDELDKMAQTAIDLSDNRIEIIVGISGNSLMSIKHNISKLNKLNIDGYLILTPYYITVSQDDLYEYYSKISEYCEHPIIIYHVPTRTSQKFLPETMVKCLLLPKVIGIKLASYDEDMLKFIKKRIKDKKLYLGSDTKINDMDMWFDGIISVFSNVNPLMIQESFNNFLVRNQLLKFLNKFSEYPNPVGVVTLMNIIGYSIGNLPFPFNEIKQSEKESLYNNYYKLINESNTVALIGDGKMGKILFDNLQDYNVKMFDIRKMDSECEKQLIKSKVIIDFSHPNSINNYMEMNFLNNPIFIIGTTGYETMDKIKKLSLNYPVLYDSNFSIGMSFIFHSLKEMRAIKKFDNYQFDIMEIHHKEKIDKPSGTAKKIKNILETSREVTSKRIKDIKGIHIVNCNGRYESLKIIHTLKDRNLIAEGVILGMKLLINKPNGLYSFEELIFSE